MTTASASPTLAPTAPTSTETESVPQYGATASTVTSVVPTRLPRGLRKEADDMSWDAFMTEYATATGPLRLGKWACTDADRPAGRLGPQARNYQATLAVGDRITTSTAAASGPIAALTAMLYDQGIALELTAFHQIPAGSHTATFIQGSDGAHAEWAMGWSEDSTQSALSAVIACANRLLAGAAA